MVTKISIGALLFVVLGLTATMANTLQCTSAMSMNADKLASTAESWQALYKSYSEFLPCDDGSIAEGFSVSVARLLTQDWKNIKDNWPNQNTDNSYEDFILKHINSTWSLDDLNAVDENTRSQCPENMSDICKKIHESVQRAKQG